MKILLIQTKAKELQIVEDSLKHSQYQIFNACSVKQAVSYLAEHQFNLVITLNILGKVSGLDFLKAIQKKFPKAARFIVDNSNEEQDDSFDISQVAHASFSLPISGPQIKTSIHNICVQQSSITSKSIVHAVKNAKTLPSPPKVYLQLNHILQSKSVDSEQIAKIVAQDPALTAKVLQFSNSAFINKGQPIVSITDAITRMGVEMLSAIVMTAELFVHESSIEGFSIENEQQHSLATAKLAASLVKPELKQQAMIAGLLHDIGKLVLFEIDKELSQRYFNQCNTTTDNMLLERKIFNCDHSQVGAYLLHTWSFSFELIQAITHHHDSKALRDSNFGAAQAVYVANKLLHDQAICPEFIQHFKLENTLDSLKKRAEKFAA